MTRTTRALLIAVLTGLLVLAVAGHSRLSGPTVLTLVEDRHGVHLGDLVAAALWVAGVGLVLRRA